MSRQVGENAERKPDAVDLIVDQWRRERPDLDVAPMGVIGRLGRSAALVQRRLEETFALFGLTRWEFDVLATLRRTGPPHMLAPTALFSALMVTSGTMTHRLKSLEASGWICREANPEDARSLLVRLTPAGLALIDMAVEAHLDNERAILSALSPAEVAALDDALARLLGCLEGGAETETAGA